MPISVRTCLATSSGSPATGRHSPQLPHRAPVAGPALSNAGDLSYVSALASRQLDQLETPPFYGLALCRHVAGRTVRPLAIDADAAELLSSYAFVDEQTRRIYVYILERSGRRGDGTVSVTAPPGYGGAGFLSRLGDTGGCGGKTPGINGFKLPASGAFRWDGHAVGPIPGTSRYDVLLGPCEVLLLSLGQLR